MEPILSQAEIDALLSRGGSSEQNTQLTAAFQVALEAVDEHFRALLARSVRVEGPYVEQVQQPLDVLFVEDVVTLPAAVGTGQFFAILSASEAKQFAAALGGDVKWAVHTLFEGWIRHLADSLSAANGMYMPVRMAEPILLTKAQLGGLAVEKGSLLVRHAVCWSQNCLEACFFIPKPSIVKLIEGPSVPVRTVARGNPRSSSRASRAVISEPLPVKTAVFTELRSPAQAAGDLPLDLVEDLTLEVMVELGHTTMTLAELMDLEPNATFALQKPAGDPVDVLVSGRLIARAEVTVVNDHFGIRILDIVPEKERVLEAGEAQAGGSVGQ